MKFTASEGERVYSHTDRDGDTLSIKVRNSRIVVFEVTDRAERRILVGAVKDAAIDLLRAVLAELEGE